MCSQSTSGRRFACGFLLIQLAVTFLTSAHCQQGYIEYFPLLLDAQFAADAPSAVTVQNGRELALALADPTVRAARLLNSVEVRDGDFADVPGPLLLLRNFTIFSTASQDSWPSLVLNATAKVQLGTAVRWYMTRVFLVATSSDFVNQGLQIFVPSAPEAGAQVVIHQGSAALVLEDNAWTASTAWIASMAGRPPGYDGWNNATFLGPKSSDCSSDPAAPPQQRCWEVSGIAVDLIAEARVITDPSAPLSPSVDKHFMLHMLNTSIFIGWAFHKTPEALPDAPAEEDTTTAAVSVTVATGREFAVALANASVTEVVVSAAAVVVNVTDSDFEGLPLPVWVQRNVTVRSNAGSRDDWPLLAMNAVKKAALGTRTTVKFTRLALQPLMTEFVFRAPSLALFGASPTAAAGGSGSRVLVQDAAIIFNVGWIATAAYKWITSLPRPASLPGLQIVEPLRVITTGCLHSESAPPMQRCYKGTSWFVDVIIEAADVDRQSGVTSPLNYITAIFNTAVSWEAVLPDSCMDELDPIQCYLNMKQSTVSLPSPTATPPAAGSSGQQASMPGSNVHGVATADGTPLAPAQPGSLSSGTAVAVIAGCAVGVTAALVAAGVALLLWKRRAARTKQQENGREEKRQQTRSADDLESPAALGSPSTTAASLMSRMGGGGTGVSSDLSGGVSIIINSTSCGRSANSLSNLPNRSSGAPGLADGGGSGQQSNGDGAEQQPSPQRQPQSTHLIVMSAVAAAVVPMTPYRADLDIRVEVVDSSSAASDVVSVAARSGVDSTAAAYANCLYESTANVSGRKSSGALRGISKWKEGAGGGPSGGDSSALPGPSIAAATPAAMAPAAAPSPGCSSDGGTAAGDGSGDVPQSIRTQAAAEVQLLPNVLGKGAYGRVVEGRYQGQPVAAKLLLGAADGVGSTAHANGIDAFIKEVECLGRIDHPCVVKLLAACVAPPRLALVMELCETSLERLVFGRAPHGAPQQLLPLPKLLHIAVQICQGLSFLHPTVIHRDLKPGNVLLRGADSDKPEVKLSDFGLARMRLHTLPTANPEVGTPGYMAPELYDLGTDTVTHHADMYSFAVVLWVMLTGQHPWQEYNVVVMAYNVTRGQRLPLDDLDPQRCPPKLARLIRACWEADPRRRPAAAEALKELLLVQEQLLMQEQDAEQQRSAACLAAGAS